MDIIRKHIIFYGDVQGVGFRYTAKYTAAANNLIGWVRNLPDGSVEMEAEGLREDIASTVQTMKNHRWGYVSDVEEKIIAVQGGNSFDIR